MTVSSPRAAAPHLSTAPPCALSAAGLHVGYLVQQFPPEVGAGPARAGEMSEHWLRAGARVTAITGMPNRPAGRIHPDYRGKLFMREDWDGVNVLRSWLFASPRHGFARTLANNLSFMATGAVSAASRARGLDVLIASSPPFFVHLAGVAAAAARRVPLVLEVRDLWPDYLAGMGVVKGRGKDALFALERRLLRAAEHVVVVTESFRERVIEKGVSPERVTVVPNGVDPARYYPDPAGARLPGGSAKPGEFVVGYLGNFGASQDLGQVLEAARIVADRDPSIRWVLVGDGTERARVDEHAARLGLPSVTLHPPIPKDETRGFYAACDLCLVPLAGVKALEEAIPSKLFETLACERPVVGSLAGEGARVLERSGAGVVARPGDPASLAEAVLRMRAAPAAERAEMGRRGRAYVQEHYARERLAERYLELLARVAGQGRR
jgi:colanic acid biosynthesis glycosyl transferase WcaI